MGDGAVYFGECRVHLAEVGFCFRLVEVFPHGVVKFLLPCYQGFAEFPQLGDSVFGSGLGDFPALFTLGFKQFF